MSKLYVYKPLKIGFIILCHDGKAARLSSTLSTINMYYPDRQCICTTGQDTANEELEIMRKKCTTHIGKNTITSLINAGLKHPPAPWNFLVMAGSYMRGRLDQKFSYFIENDKDILFPLVNRKMYFMDGTLNGVLMHRNAYKDVGEMPEHESIELCKLEWAGKAIEKGYTFKAIVGSKIC